MDSNLFWCISGIIGGGMLSLIISSFFYFFGLKRKRLTYKIDTFSLIPYYMENNNDLKMTYRSKELERLYCSIITIKNSGNCLLEKSDFSSPNPVIINTDGQFILSDYSRNNIISRDCKGNPTCQYDSNYCYYVIINFDFIPKKEKIVFKLLHTEPHIYIETALKEGKIRKNENNLYIQ